MAKWKPLQLNEDILNGAKGELLGIEELQCPDDLNIVYGTAEKKEPIKPKKRKVLNGTKKNKKKQKLKRPIKIKKIPFQTFKHHNKMSLWGEFGLQDEVLASLYDQKFFEPTEIQMKSLGPAVCGYRDILGAAETGSGKTLAFGIPIVNGILGLKSKAGGSTEDTHELSSEENDWVSNENGLGCVKVKSWKTEKVNNRLYALILTPTRELAVQVKNHLTSICKYTDIKVVLLVGGLAQEKQERLLKKRPEIIVATPGRLWDLIQSRNIHLQDISKLRYLAIDETDRMLEKGHFEELNCLLEHLNLNEFDKKKRQNFVFSATLTLVHDPPAYRKFESRNRITPGQKLQELIKRIGITNPKIIDVTNSQITPENLKEHKVICKLEEKDYYLLYFLKKNCGKTIIFSNSIGCVKRLANLLSILDFNPLPLHANMLQKQRLKNLEKFRGKGNSILIATDVAARGLDIINVDHVLHYQVPRTAETYVHRSGRTARKKKFGSVLLLIEPQEYKFYNKLLHTLGRGSEIEDLLVDNGILNYVKKVIHLARDIDQISLAFKKQKSANSWYTKAVAEMDIIVDEDDLPSTMSNEANKKMTQDLNAKRKKLKQLIDQSYVSRILSGKFPSRDM